MEDPEFAGKYRKERQALAEIRIRALEGALAEMAEKALNRSIEMVADESASIRLGELIGAWAKAIETMRLLRGESTSNVEVMDAKTRAEQLRERIEALRSNAINRAS